MSQANLNRRVEKARFAARAEILQKIAGGFRVPSRTQVNHHIVLVHYLGNGKYKATCHYENVSLGQWKCPGNQYGHVCWHVIAAFTKGVGRRSIAFFENVEDAMAYTNLGGGIITIKSGDGSGKLFAVVKE